MKVGKLSRRFILIVAMLTVGTLLLVSLWLTCFRPDGLRQSHPPEDVAQGYLEALLDQDYEKALYLLSPAMPKMPGSEEAFLSDLERAGDLPIAEMQACYYVEEVAREGETASIKLREQYYDPCLGIEIQNLSYDWIWVRLRMEKDGWRIIHASKYFSSGWNNAAGISEE